MYRKSKRFIGLFMAMIMVFVSAPNMSASEDVILYHAEHSPELIFENFDSSEFPFSFEILEYEDGTATVVAIPMTYGLDVESIQIVSNDEFQLDEGRHVVVQDGIFTVNVNTFYAFSASSLIDDIRTYYFCNIMLELSDIGLTHYLTVHVRDIAIPPGFEDFGIMPLTEVVHFWRVYNIRIETTFRMNGWSSFLNQSVSATQSNTGMTQIRHEVNQGFIYYGTQRTVSRNLPNIIVYNGTNTSAAEWLYTVNGANTNRRSRTNTSTATNTMHRGTFREQIFNTNRNAFPDNGVSGSFWYVYAGWGIREVPVTGVSVSPASAAINVNATRALSATVSPSNATNRNVTWSSNNTNVATVDSWGTVTGRAPGTATITVRTNDGGRTATSNITVTSAVVTPTVTITSPANNANFNVGSAVNISASGSNPTWRMAISVRQPNGSVVWVESGALVSSLTRQFIPTQTGTHTIEVFARSFPENDARSGQGVASRSFTVTAAGTSQISASPTALDFGSHPVGYTQRPTQTITITNTGTQNITLNALPGVPNRKGVRHMEYIVLILILVLLIMVSMKQK